MTRAVQHTANYLRGRNIQRATLGTAAALLQAPIGIGPANVNCRITSSYRKYYKDKPESAVIVSADPFAPELRKTVTTCARHCDYSHPLFRMSVLLIAIIRTPYFR